MSNRFSPRPTARAQRGGTFLGLIIGLLVGLGAALVMAVYVAKVPTPFMNKTPVRSSDQEAAENEKNKNWNPNATMQSKVPVKPLPGSDTPSADAPAPDAEPAPVHKPEAKAPAKSDAKADKATDVKGVDIKADTKVETKADRKGDDTKPSRADKPTAASADPIGDFARAQTSSPPKADPFIYQVQTGAFRSADEADAQRARLALQGVDARVTEREQSGRTVYRVRTGPFEQRADAERLRERLDHSGFETVLVRIQR